MFKRLFAYEKTIYGANIWYFARILKYSCCFWQHSVVIFLYSTLVPSQFVAQLFGVAMNQFVEFCPETLAVVHLQSVAKFVQQNIIHKFFR